MTNEATTTTSAAEPRVLLPAIYRPDSVFCFNLSLSLGLSEESGASVGRRPLRPTEKPEGKGVGRCLAWLPGTVAGPRRS